MDLAFQYVKDNGGIDTEDSYEYDAMDETCHFDPSNVGATVSGFVDIPSDDEDALKSALATQVVAFLVLNKGFISTIFLKNI